MIYKGNLLWHSGKGALSLNEPTKSLLESLSGVSGIYFLSDSESGDILYVGRSKDLGSRITTSMSERSLNFFDFIATASESDSYLLELFYICVFKPKYNKESNANDDLSAGFMIPRFYNKELNFKCAGSYLNWEEKEALRGR